MKLRLISPADEAQVLDILTSDLVKQTYMLPDFADREAALPLFRRLVAQSEDPGRFVRAIDLDGKLVGFLNDVEVSGASIEVGYAVHPDHWGKGCATAGLKLAIEELFQQGRREITAGAFAENPASLRVMENAGMTRIPKTDEIEYRGKIHKCIYYTIRAMELVKPTLEELNFRQSLLADAGTMSYNHAYGGIIDFPESRWKSWYQKWIGAEDPHYFYRYLYSRALDTCVGEAAWHYEAETGRYLCDVIVHAKYRGRGFGTSALNLLCSAAKENGIHELYDEILLDNPSVHLFLKNGFREVGRTEKTYLVKKELI